MLHFKSITKDETISFKVDYKLIDNVYYFDDLSTTNTKISLEIASNNHVILKRSGDNKMSIDFVLNATTSNFYHNNMGLEAILKIKTNKIIIKNNQIYFEYDNIFDNFLSLNHKIWIIIK